MSQTDPTARAALLAAAARADLHIPPEELDALTAAFRARNLARCEAVRPEGLQPAFTFHPATPVRA